MRFADREEAGRRLAAALEHLRGEDAVILALPRGGVPVAAVVADSLDAPIDVIVVRKLGLPSKPELGLGAVGENGIRVINEPLLRSTGLGSDDLAAVERRESAEVRARAIRYRGGRKPIPLSGRTVVLVDDGIATGSTMVAACQVVRAHGAGRVVVAVPVSSSNGLSRVRDEADEVVCLHTKRPLISVGASYRDFSQTTEQEVIHLLRLDALAAQPAPDDEVMVKNVFDIDLLARRLAAATERVRTVSDCRVGYLGASTGAAAAAEPARDWFLGRLRPTCRIGSPRPVTGG